MGYKEDIYFTSRSWELWSLGEKAAPAWGCSGEAMIPGAHLAQFLWRHKVKGLFIKEVESAGGQDVSPQNMPLWPFDFSELKVLEK